MLHPLKDKTILVTRAADQVVEFTQQLNHLGASTICLPLIKNEPIHKSELKELTNKLSQYIFSDYRLYAVASIYETKDGSYGVRSLDNTVRMSKVGSPKDIFSELNNSLDKFIAAY